MNINKIVDDWEVNASKGELPYGRCFYKGFKIVTAVSQNHKPLPIHTINNEGVFWMFAINTLERIRNNRLPLKISIKNDHIKWNRYNKSEFTSNELVLKHGRGFTEEFQVITSGFENVNSKLFSNNHFASSQFNCQLKKSKYMKSKIIRIFLASSNELKEDRTEFELFINRENKLLIEKNIFIKLIVWEDFIDTMSRDGLQAEYNKAAKNSDIFIMLFFTKVGPYTLEEFESAFGEFSVNNKPLIYTYFKDDNIRSGSLGDEFNTVLEFQSKLKKLKHYYTTYTSLGDLKYKFKCQLDKLFAENMV